VEVTSLEIVPLTQKDKRFLQIFKTFDLFVKQFIYGSEIDDDWWFLELRFNRERKEDGRNGD